MKAFQILCVLLFAFPLVAQGQQSESKLQEELRPVSLDAFAVGIVRPARMFEVEGIADIPLVDAKSMLGVRPSEVEHFVVAIVPSSEGVIPLFVAKCSIPIDQDQVLKLLCPNARKGNYSNEVTVFSGNGGMSVAFPSERHLFFSLNIGVVLNAVNRFKMKPSLNKTFQRESTLLSKLKDGAQAHAQVVGDFEKFKHYTRFHGKTYNPLGNEFWNEFYNFVPKGTEQVEAVLDLDSKIPFKAKLLTSSNKQQFLTAAQEPFNRCKEQWEQIKSGANDATESMGIVNRLKLVGSEEGVEVRYESNGTPAEIWVDILAIIKRARSIPARAAAMLQVRNNFRRVGLALLNHERAHAKFPSNIRSKNEVALLSWRVAILPMLGRQKLYESFKLDEPWDSEHNLKLLDKMPEVFRDTQNKSLGQKETRVQAVVGQGTANAFEDLPIRKITDGLSNSVALVLTKRSVPWTKPIDHAVNLKDPWANLSLPATVGMFDGSIKILNKLKHTEQLKLGFTIADGEIVKWDDPRQTYAEDVIDSKTDLLKRFAASGLSEPVAEFAALSEYRLQGVAIPKDAKDTAIKFVKSKDPNLVGLGLLLLKRIDSEVDWKLLRSELSSEYISNRNKAIQLVVKTREPDAIAAVFQDASFVQQVWQSFYEENLDKDAVRKLVPFLKDEQPDMRIAAGFTLANFGKEAYRNEIEALLEDKDEEVRKAAKEMIKAIE